MISKSEAELAKFLQENIEIGKHVFVIAGFSGIGKTHTVERVANTNEFIFLQIDSNVADLKEVIHTNLEDSEGTYLVCIENLDLGVLGTQQTLLKTIEEYAANVYWVITCHNLKYLQETIISRSLVFNMLPPTSEELIKFAQELNSSAYEIIRKAVVWKAVQSFADVNLVLYLFNQDKSKFDYLNELFPIKYTDSISNISYRIQHYPDKSKIPLDFLFKLIIANSRNVNVQYEAIKHLADLERLNSYAVVNHFLFSVKYLAQN